MENLTKLINSEQGQALIKQMTQQLNLNEEQATEGAKQLMPMIQAGLQKQVSEHPNELASTLQDKAASLMQAAAPTEDNPSDMASVGNALLGQIFGSKDVSREVASKAAENTGLDVSALKSMLPMLASVAGGALLSNSKKKSGLMGLVGGLMGSKAAGGLNFGLAKGLLDQDGDGEVSTAEIMSLASKFLKK